MRTPSAPPGAAGGLTDGDLAFGDSSWTDGPGRTTRTGSVDVVHGDSAFQARVGQRARGHLRALPRGGPQGLLPGIFTVAPDGGVSFVATIETAGGPRLRTVAERVSMTVLRQPRR